MCTGPGAKVTERRAAEGLRRLHTRAHRPALSPRAERIRVVLDNLSTHSPGTLYQTYAPAEARRILRRSEFHYVPKHASWLNMVKIEIGVLARQCLDRRIDSHARLAAETAAWQKRRNAERARIKWKFTTKKARAKMGRASPKTRCQIRPSSKSQNLRDEVLEELLQWATEPVSCAIVTMSWVALCESPPLLYSCLLRICRLMQLAIETQGEHVIQLKDDLRWVFRLLSSVRIHRVHWITRKRLRPISKFQFSEAEIRTILHRQWMVEASDVGCGYHALIRAVLDEVCRNLSPYQTGVRAYVASKMLEAAARQSERHRSSRSQDLGRVHHFHFALA
ncbi:hypothetical protein ACVILL_000994 [Bradyrhizobium sp. USDA 3364]